MSSLHEVMQQITKCRKAGEVSYSNFIRVSPWIRNIR